MSFPDVVKDIDLHFYSNTDLIIKARLDRSEIQMLCKWVEGLGHLGVVTTTDKVLGEVMIQTTKFCWPELKTLIERMPLEIEFYPYRSL